MTTTPKPWFTYYDLGVDLQRCFEDNCTRLYQTARRSLSDEEGREPPARWWQAGLGCLGALRPWLLGWQSLADEQGEYLATALLRCQRQLGEQRERLAEEMLSVWLAGLQRLEPPGPFALLDQLLGLPAASAKQQLPMVAKPGENPPPSESGAQASPAGKSRASAVTS